VLDVPFLLIEHRDGVALSDRLPEGCDDGAALRLTQSLVGAMAELHAVDPGTVGLADLGRPEGFLSRQLSAWRRRAETVWPDGVPETFLRLAHRLDGEAVEEGGVSLVHMDLKFDNMLVDPESMAAKAVIDWDMTTRGDPLFDLAVLLAYWIEPTDPEPVHGLRRVPSLEPGFPRRRDVVDLYVEATGRAPVRLDWYLAVARLRLAVLWTQLFRSWERGDLRGDHYGAFGELALALVELADQKYSEGTL
jgi:aminoglycoside phosphotransferase (APT) family kinase protein